MTSGLPATRTEAPDTPRPRPCGLLDPYTDLGTPPRKEPKSPKHLRRKTSEVITREALSDRRSTSRYTMDKLRYGESPVNYKHPIAREQWGDCRAANTH